ncbi:MAG: hypothetical protein R2838_14995 [Caldilineaceae bacterium]
MAALAPVRPTDVTLARLLHQNADTLGRRRSLVLITPQPPAAEATWSTPAWLPELLRIQAAGLAASALLVAQDDDLPAADVTRTAGSTGRACTGAARLGQVAAPRHLPPQAHGLPHHAHRRRGGPGDRGGGGLMQATSMPEMTQDESHWALRQGRRLVDRRRPYLGWLVLVLTMLIATLPALALDVHDWLRAARLSGAVRTVGPVAVLVMWLALGWRRPRDIRWRWWQTLLLYAGLMLLGAVAQPTLPALDPGPAALVAQRRDRRLAGIDRAHRRAVDRASARACSGGRECRRRRGSGRRDFAGGAGLLAWFTGW